VSFDKAEFREKRLRPPAVAPVLLVLIFGIGSGSHAAQVTGGPPPLVKKSNRATTLMAHPFRVPISPPNPGQALPPSGP